jgi:malate dehydrogenase (oxaloacetate-decarboxylating)
VTIIPSASYSITVRLEVPADGLPASQLTGAVEAVGGMVTAFDVTAARGDVMQVDLTCAAPDADHADQIVDALRAVQGVTVGKVSDRTFLLHLGGKIEIQPKVALRTRDDLSMAYTPGVARVSRAIVERPDDVRRLTIKRNAVAVVTDGSAVLGLGNIGPAAALPVMEGKAALFKRFAGIDAWPICLATQDTEEIIRTVQIIAPVFGGINLEDIAAPRCFEIERRLRALLDIPVFHDDQHGTAIVVLGALTNALRVVGKQLPDVRILLSGAGAAGSAILDLLLAAGANDVVVGDVRGIVCHARDDLDASLVSIADRTNRGELSGPLVTALPDADVFIGVSAPNVISEEDVKGMAPDAIVFALANPDPEINPAVARRHAAVVATGRSDFPNQINNVLAFPGVFRGLLDAQSHAIPREALLAAATALADVVTEEERHANYIVPSVFHPELATTIAAAVRRAVEEHRPGD